MSVFLAHDWGFFIIFRCDISTQIGLVHFRFSVLVLSITHGAGM